MKVSNLIKLSVGIAVRSETAICDYWIQKPRQPFIYHYKDNLSEL